MGRPIEWDPEVDFAETVKRLNAETSMKLSATLTDNFDHLYQCQNDILSALGNGDLKGDQIELLRIGDWNGEEEYELDFTLFEDIDTLELYNLSVFTEIPFIPGLRCLVVSDCEEVTRIHKPWMYEKLLLAGMDSIETLDEAIAGEEWKTLDFSVRYTPLVKLPPVLPKCTKFDISCLRATSIPRLPVCEDFTMHRMKFLSYVDPYMPKVERLYVTNCELLTDFHVIVDTPLININTNAVCCAGPPGVDLSHPIADKHNYWKSANARARSRQMWS